MEDISMDNKYKVIEEFDCHGKRMVTVRLQNAAHVMTLEDWHKIYGRNHQDKWKTKVDWNSFTLEGGYKTKVS